MRRMAWAVVTIFVVITFNFFLFRVLPGDPAKAGVKDPRMSPETEAALAERFGLDKPVFLNLEGEPLRLAILHLPRRSWRRRPRRVVRPTAANPSPSCWRWLSATRCGSCSRRRSSSIAARRRLGPGRGLAARKSGIDCGAVAVALLLWSLPTFFLGIILLFFGAGTLGLPTGGRARRSAPTSDTAWEACADLITHLILPTLTLALVIFGEYVLIMRSSVLDVFSEDYILTAKAKGLTTWRIIRGTPCATRCCPWSRSSPSTSASWWPAPSRPRCLLVARFRPPHRDRRSAEKDYPVLQGTFLLIAVVVVAANLLADLAYGLLDPRVSEA